MEMQISSRKIEVGEELLIILSLTNLNERELMQKKYDPFILIGGPSQSRSMNTSIINGRMSSSQTNSYTFQFVCKKTGKYTFPKITFKLADGTLAESQPVVIEVVKQGSLPRQAQQRQPDPYDPFAGFFDPFDPFANQQQRQPQAPPQTNNSGIYTDPSKLDLKRDIFARIHVNKNKVYVGEQIYASIKIYTALNSKGFEAEKLPNFNGFWSQDIPMPEKLEMKRETINGREFVSVEIKRITLFPTKAGTLEITPLKMKTIALVPVSVKPQRNSRQPRDLMEAIQMMMDAQMNSVGGVEFKEIPYSFSSGSEKITVLPLPENAPASFTGGVGKYTFNSFIDKKELKTDEALNYRLELNGTGNLPMIDAPKATWSEDFELYDPQLKENYSSVPSFSGTKVWNYVAIPHQPGNFQTPNLEFTYFDLDQKKYVTLTAPSTPIKVTGSPTKAKEKSKKFDEFNYAKQKIKESAPYAKSNTLSNSLFYGLGILPLILAFIIGFLPKNEEKSERFISGKRISEQVTKQMKQAEIHLKAEDKNAFYQELTRAYWNYLGNKLRMETSDLSRSNISDKLKERKVSDDLIQQMINLIDRSEMGLYTAYGSQAMETLYNESLTVLNELEKILV